MRSWNATPPVESNIYVSFKRAPLPLLTANGIIPSWPLAQPPGSSWRNPAILMPLTILIYSRRKPYPDSAESIHLNSYIR